MKRELICPTCGSDDVMKNGMIRRGKQNHKCRDCGRRDCGRRDCGRHDCGRQFVENPQWKPKAAETLEKIQLLLLERISLAGIVRVMGGSESWLQRYVNCRLSVKGHHVLPVSGLVELSWSLAFNQTFDRFHFNFLTDVTEFRSVVLTL